jgi:hypothetical protein
MNAPVVPHQEHTPPLRLFLFALTALALLLPVADAHAQGKKTSGPTGLSDKDKAELKQKNAFEKETDAAYKKSLERIPAKQQKVDPWGSVREAPAK